MLHRAILCITAVLSALGPLPLLPSGPAAAAPGACAAAAAAVEREQGLPPNLLLAIGLVESGRRDPSTGAVVPWPWAVNDEGRDRYFNSQAEAVAYVRQTQAGGARSIDVGCFQINLHWHPGAFASLEMAFDPDANARYAGRFLAALALQRGGWDAAVAAYHSANAALGTPYRDAVLAVWGGRRRPPTPGGAPGEMFGMRVFGPENMAEPAEPAGTAVGRRRLPVVVGPEPLAVVLRRMAPEGR